MCFESHFFKMYRAEQRRKGENSNFFKKISAAPVHKPNSVEL